MLAVADGHGSAHFVRSEIGAAIAVQLARSLLRDLGEDYYHTGDAVASKHFIDQRLATLLVRGWRKLVARASGRHPTHCDGVRGWMNRCGHAPGRGSLSTLRFDAGSCVGDEGLCSLCPTGGWRHCHRRSERAGDAATVASRCRPLCQRHFVALYGESGALAAHLFSTHQPPRAGFDHARH